MDGWIAVACTSAAQQQALRETVLTSQEGVGPADLTATLTYELFGDFAQQWLHRLQAAGVPAARVFEESYYQDYLRQDDLVAAGRVFEIQHPRGGRVRAAALMFRASRYRGTAGSGAPLLGSHSREILQELGFGSRAEDLTSRGIVIVAPEPT
jgi:crotonobetainyl-CoA:carnitine CoA-transferase CaiB-like acyl-CoA transferase